MKKMFLTLAVFGLLVSSCDKQEESIDTLQVQQAEEVALTPEMVNDLLQNSTPIESDELSAKGLNPFRTLLAEKGWKLHYHGATALGNISTFINSKNGVNQLLIIYKQTHITGALLLADRSRAFEVTHTVQGYSAQKNLELLENLYEQTEEYLPAFTEVNVNPVSGAYGSKFVGFSSSGGVEYADYQTLTSVLPEKEAKAYANRYHTTITDPDGKTREFYSISKGVVVDFIPGVYTVGVRAYHGFDELTSEEAEFVFFYEEDPNYPWLSLNTSSADGFFPSWAAGTVTKVEVNPGLYPHYRIITLTHEGVSSYNVFNRDADTLEWNHLGYGETRDKALALFSRHHYRNN